MSVASCVMKIRCHADAMTALRFQVAWVYAWYVPIKIDVGVSIYIIQPENHAKAHRRDAAAAAVEGKCSRVALTEPVR